MKILKKVSIGFVSLALGLVLPVAALAATSPSFGSTSTYGVASSTFTNSNTAPQTVINGDVCYTTGPTTPPISISGATVTPCPSSVGTDQGSALADMNAQANAVTCTNLGPAPALNAVTIPGYPTGTFPPGCYTSDAAMSITVNTTVTLSGSGTYIFRSGGALTTGANSLVTLANGANACNVFWAPVGATTLGANASLSSTPTFVGNIFDAAGISVGHFVNLLGRALAFGGTVTTDANTISVPNCSTPPPTPPTPPSTPTPVQPVIAITKIPTLLSSNSTGGTVQFDYTVTNPGTVTMTNITVVDNKCSAVSFVSGDTNVNNMLEVGEAWHYRCTMDVSQTTTNVATASGLANGFTATATASAIVNVNAAPVVTPPVVVLPPAVVPKLPKTGYAPEQNITLWTIIQNLLASFF
jgi:uncharacterized repeat protein (TIGR01451 family)